MSESQNATRENLINAAQDEVQSVSSTQQGVDSQTQTQNKTKQKITYQTCTEGQGMSCRSHPDVALNATNACVPKYKQGKNDPEIPECQTTCVYKYSKLQ